MAGLIGSIAEFNSKNCRFSDYVARLRAIFAIIGVKEDNKVNFFIAIMGNSMYNLVVNLCTPSVPSSKTFDELVKILVDHFEPPALEVAERQHFLTRHQKDSESISDFVEDLKQLSISCNYGDHIPLALRDQFVLGIRNDSAKRRLLTEANLSFDKAIQIALQLEVADKELLQLQGPSTSASVQMVKSKKPFQKRKTHRDHALTHGNGSQCQRCGAKDHWAPKCKFIDSICNKCKKKVHLAKVCRSSKSNSATTKCSVGTILHTSVGSIPDSYIPNTGNNTIGSLETVLDQNQTPDSITTTSTGLNGTDSSCQIIGYVTNKKWCQNFFDNYEDISEEELNEIYASMETSAASTITTEDLINTDEVQLISIGSPSTSISLEIINTCLQPKLLVSGSVNSSVTINKISWASRILHSKVIALFDGDIRPKFFLDWTINIKKFSTGFTFTNLISFSLIPKYSSTELNTLLIQHPLPNINYSKKYQKDILRIKSDVSCSDFDAAVEEVMHTSTSNINVSTSNESSSTRGHVHILVVGFPVSVRDFLHFYTNYYVQNLTGIG